MPRPKGGYTNSVGQPIPGTSDITGRFKDSSRLLYWAFNRGKSGAAKLNDDSALDIGTAVHKMAEQDLKGYSDADIIFHLNETVRSPDDQEKAMAAFGAFRKWRASFAVALHKQEISLVSEQLQFGGTLDVVARMRRGRGLVDFKTSKTGEVFADHLLQLAAYGILWEENFPAEPLNEGYHLIVLPKDGSKPIHREFTKEQLHPFKQQFWLLRKAYDLDALCNDPKLLKGTPVAPSVAPAQAPPKRAPRRGPIRPAEVCAGPRLGASIGEMLRAYGHVRDEART